MNEAEKRNHAWIGDAVLALYARQWILEQKEISNQERANTFIKMTSNKFLSSLGEPTAMEAEIGVIYQKQGLQPAFDHIQSKFLPVFQKQQAKAKQPGNYRNKR